jgi:hypothetical protein
MKTYILLAVLLGSAILAALVIADDGGKVKHGEDAVSSLPGSLDNLYPPKSPAPVFYLEMHNLSRPLSGIICDLFENDFENARNDFDAFRKQYVKISSIVPEWAGMYPISAVDQLDTAMKTGDRGKIMSAIDGIGRVCDGCHLKYMPQAQHRYHWGEFSAITATDPLTGEDVSFQQLMLRMESNMTGIGIDLQQGQPENAGKQLGGFEARFQAVKQTCVACHEQERRYYVNDEIIAKFNDLKQVLSKNAVDAKAAGELLQQIGQESCFKCHLVHIPSAYAERRQAGQ